MIGGENPVRDLLQKSINQSQLRELAGHDFGVITDEMIAAVIDDPLSPEGARLSSEERRKIGELLIDPAYVIARNYFQAANRLMGVTDVSKKAEEYAKFMANIEGEFATRQSDRAFNMELGEKPDSIEDEVLGLLQLLVSNRGLQQVHTAPVGSSQPAAAGQPEQTSISNAAQSWVEAKSPPQLDADLQQLWDLIGNFERDIPGIEAELTQLDVITANPAALAAIGVKIQKLEVTFATLSKENTKKLDEEIERLGIVRTQVAQDRGRFGETNARIDQITQLKERLRLAADRFRSLKSIFWAKSLVQQPNGEFSKLIAFYQPGADQSKLTISFDPNAPEYAHLINQGQKSLAASVDFYSRVVKALHNARAVIKNEKESDGAKFIAENLIQQAENFLVILRDRLITSWQRERKSAFPDSFDETKPGSLAHNLKNANDHVRGGFAGLTPQQARQMASNLASQFALEQERVELFFKNFGLEESFFELADRGKTQEQIDVFEATVKEFEAAKQKLHEKLSPLHFQMSAVENQLRGYLAPGISPIILNSERDQIGEKFSSIEKSVGEIATLLDSVRQSNPPIPAAELAVEEHRFVELKKLWYTTQFAVVCWSLEASVASYENNNKPAGNYFGEQSTAVDNNGIRYANEAIANAGQDGFVDLQNRMVAKLDIVKDIFSTRGLMYAGYDALKKPVFGVGGVSRSYPDGDPGYFGTKDLFSKALTLSYNPQEWSELQYPGEIEQNPHVCSSRFRIRLAEAVSADEDTLNGARIIRRDGRWLELESQLNLKQLLFMMAHEMFSSRKFSANYTNYHQQGIYESFHQIAKKEVLPEFIEKYAIPFIVNEGYFLEKQEALDPRPTGKRLVELKAQWLKEPELLERQQRVRTLLGSATEGQIKQAIIAYLPTLLPQMSSEGGSVGMSDTMWYSHHLYYIITDALRKTNPAIPLRLLMFASPDGNNVWDLIDTVYSGVRTERYKSKKGFASIGQLFMGAQQMPNVQFKPSVEGVISSFAHEHGQKFLDRYRHILNGFFVPLNDESYFDPESPAVQRRAGNPDSDIMESVFSGRKLGPYRPGFRTPWSYLIARNPDKTVRCFPDEYNEKGQVLNFGKIVTMADFTDGNGMPRPELFGIDNIIASAEMSGYYASVGSKVAAIYKGSISKPIGSLGDLKDLPASNKDIVYGAHGFPGGIGECVQIGQFKDSDWMTKMSELMALADALTMAMKGKTINEISHTMESAGDGLEFESKEVIMAIVNATYAQAQIYGDLTKKFIEQVNSAFKYE